MTTRLLLGLFFFTCFVGHARAVEKPQQTDRSAMNRLTWLSDHREIIALLAAKHEIPEAYSEDIAWAYQESSTNRLIIKVVKIVSTTKGEKPMKDDSPLVDQDLTALTAKYKCSKKAVAAFLFDICLFEEAQKTADRN
jgi:hypothetical protein